MPPAHPQSAASDRNGADKRHFQRYHVRIDAVCTTLRGVPQHGCEIRDLCLGGMLLHYRQETARTFLPMVGEQVDIRCAIPGDAQQNILRFRARVVRTDGESAGITLIHPDPHALRLLIDYAAAQQGLATQAPPTGNRPDADTRRRLTAACAELARAALPPLLKDFIANGGGQLFDAADHARNGTEQNGYFDAIAIINRSHGLIQESFTGAFLEQLEAGPRQGAKPATPPTATLSLVEEDVLDEWLAVSDVANYVESRQQRELKELEQRLGQLYGTAIEGEGNPFGPHAFALAFQRMLKTLGLARSANQVCYTSFKGTLLIHHGELLAKLNSLLIEGGILPEIRVGVAIKRNENPAAGRERRQEPRQADTTGVRGTNDPKTAETPVRRTASNEARDLYGVVRDIFSLRRQFGYHSADEAAGFDLHPGHAADIGTATVSAGMPQAEVYTRDEVLAALSRVQAQGGGSGPRADAAGRHSRILSLIADQGALGDGGKRVGGREGGIMYVAGNVFESMFQDLLLENSVRTWLQRLEIPLLKQAILDESIFVDKSHVARQVVNRISQLELYGAGEGGADNAIQHQINTLLGRIAGEIDVDPEIFSKVLKRLNALIQIQDSAYADNVRDVITACENEAPAAIIDNAAADTPALEEWRKRVLRLKTGNWVLFTPESGDAQRLRLAWISVQRDRYVFVNLRGQREMTLDPGQLAARLQTGSAVVLDGADEPAMDRAQYNMLQNLHHQLLFETTHDQLTGLVNRREFERLLQEKIEDARLGDAVHALLYIDIDQFNVINTTCGYDAGDKLLTEIGAQITGSADKGRIAGRIGADEFCLLLENSSSVEANRIAEQLIERIRDYRFAWDDKRFSVSFGIGLIQLDGTITSAAQVLQATESSCRAAKQQGVNRIQIHRPDDEALYSEQQSMKWIARIDRALEEDELDLRYQSIVAVGDGPGARPHHVEVLLGVTDEDGNPISPQELIMAAEHYHRMPAIDRWVIRTAFAWMAQNTDKVESVGGLAINLSGRSLSDDTFKEFILEEARRSGVAMDRVCFEVTETAGIGNLTDAAEFILDMKKSGCTFALDDFGSGLSSYAYLKNLPVDFLKIDGAFVKEMDRNPSDFAVVKSITEIGHFMGKKIIAEYVENDAILALLRDIGVDYAQGYVIDKPRRLFDIGG